MLFLRALALITALAFLSLRRQILGLVGSRGILPVSDFLDAYRGMPAFRRWRIFPTLFWLSSSDSSLKLACDAGLVASVILATGFATTLSLLVIWALYLSLMIAGQDFLGFQWDSLLVETAFFAAFLPYGLIPLLLLRWLLFRLMFESGMVKLSCGDLTWRRLAALDYHYFTQPLPTPLAWYFHHSPRWFRKASVAATYGIEIVLPFLFFGPPLARAIGCVGTCLLMLVILLTGNYTFFNWLTIALSLLLLDDAAMSAIPFWALGLELALAAFVLLVTVPQLIRAIRPRFREPRFLRRLAQSLAPFRTLNPYGLFRVMTLERPEIEVEGSNDGKSWLAYGFRAKIGALDTPPRWVAPHQPRLDWQMWFAALGSFDDTPWFTAFLVRLLEGEREVLGLLAVNPFPDKPPRYVRAILYKYEFSSPEEKRRRGRWWRRVRIGPYSPRLSLSEAP